MFFLGVGVEIFREIWPILTFLPTREVSIPCWNCFFLKKGQLRLYYGVSHRGVGRNEKGEIGP